MVKVFMSCREHSPEIYLPAYFLRVADYTYESHCFCDESIIVVLRNDPIVS